MKLNQPDAGILGDIGAGAAQRWGPRRFDYYQYQWRTQRGAWGDPQAADHLSADVADVVATFKTRGTLAGLELAKAKGVLVGAQEWLAIRTLHEEDLAARWARVRARIATKPLLDDKIREAFMAARLAELREAARKAETPGQAVIDKPEIPRRSIPRWVTFLAFGLSAVAFLRSMR